MVHYYRYFLFLSVIIHISSVTAQDYSQTDLAVYEWNEYFDRSYGADNNLLNGIKYLETYSNATGHPFFWEDQFSTGNLVINGLIYPNVQIKYDICNQKIILQYIYPSGRITQIILNNEFIDEFIIYGKLFRKYSFDETGTKFFQVVASGEMSCLLYWKKNLVYSATSTWNPYSFTPQTRKAYLLVEGRPNLFRSKKSFLKLMPKQYSEEIKRFIRTNHIRLRKASDGNLRDLMNFCGSLTEIK